MENNSFFSMDKFLELGLNIEMAKQVMGVVNSTLNSMQMPGRMPDHSSVSKVLPSLSADYYVVMDGAAHGPYTSIEISNLIQKRKIIRSTYVWKKGLLNWKFAADFPELLDYIEMVETTPPPIPQV